MDLRQLNALVALADHGTFSAAADALHTVQSNVSAHIGRLETELGSSLFDRTGGHLTEEGEAVVRRARRITAELDAARADVAELRDEVVGGVTIGMIGTTARWLVPQMMGEMNERHPLVHLRISEGTTTALEPQLSSGKLDMAVILLPPPSSVDLATEDLFEEDMFLIVPTEDKFAGLESVNLRQLANMSFLLPPRGTAARTEIDSACRAMGVSLIAKAEIDGVRLATSLTFDGYGPALLPATAMPSFLNEGWSLVRVDGLPRRRVGLAYPRRSYPSAPARALREILKRIVANDAEMHPGLHPSAASN